MAEERYDILEKIIAEEIKNNPKTAAFNAAMEAGNHAEAKGHLSSMQSIKLMNDVLDRYYNPKPHDTRVNDKGEWNITRMLPMENAEWFAKNVEEKLGIKATANELGPNLYRRRNKKDVPTGYVTVDPVQKGILENLFYERAYAIVKGMYLAVSDSKEHEEMFLANKEPIIRAAIHRMIDEYVTGKITSKFDHPELAELTELENRRIAAQQALRGSGAEYKAIAEQKRAQLAAELAELPQAKAYHANEQRVADLEQAKTRIATGLRVADFVEKKLREAGIKSPITRDKDGHLQFIAPSYEKKAQCLGMLEKLGIPENAYESDYGGMGFINTKYAITVRLNSPQVIESIVSTEMDKRLMQRNGRASQGDALYKVIQREVMDEVVGPSKQVGAAAARG